MNTRRTHDKPGPQLRDLVTGETFSISGVRGGVIRTVQGRVWVTQEGDPRDYVVPAHGRFCIARKGLIVVNALADGTQIAIYRVKPEPPGDWQRNAVRVDPAFTEAAHRAAREEMVRWFACLARKGWLQLRRLWSRRSGKPLTAVMPCRQDGCRC
jgi:Protein of unknown function (DUF2917)